MNIHVTHTPSPNAKPFLGGFIKTSIKGGALLYWAALLTVGAAGIHFVGVLEQQPQSVLLTALLYGFALLQAIVALAVIAIPTYRWLLIASIVEGMAIFLWIFAHTIGLPIGTDFWRPETLGLQDYFLPAMEIASTCFFLCLFARTWSSLQGNLVLKILPSLLVICFLLWGAINMLTNFYATSLLFVICIFTFPGSLFDLFLPILGLLFLFLLLRFIIPRLHRFTSNAWRTALVLLPALLLVSLLSWVGGSTAATRGWFSPSSAVNIPSGQTKSLAYCNPTNGPLAMELSEPNIQAKQPAPVVLYVHGGAGFRNSRDLQTDDDGIYWMQIRNQLLSQGFVVGSIDYALIPLSSWQDMVKDAKCALRFLRAHAGELRIDPQRFGVYGDSEGGYISAMLGTAGPEAGFDTGEYPKESSRVQAVVDLYGFTDLTDMSGSPDWARPFGTNRPKSELRASSPITYITPGAPPFLIIHGSDDNLIAPHHSQDMARRLQAAGVSTTLLMVQNGGHGMNAALPGKVQQPDARELVNRISNFFVRTQLV